MEERKDRAVRLLARLCEAHGAPGNEGAVRRIIRDEFGEGTETDRMGNLILKKPGNADSPRIMLTAHMDEVGFIVQSITKSGLIKFLPLGGWWPHTILAQRVRVLTQSGREIVGVVGAKPPHFLSEAEREKVMKIDDMFIDVGALDGEDIRNRFGIRLGDTIDPDSAFVPMQNPDLFLCKAYDNRVGMALVAHILQILKEEHHPNTVYGVGTVQEEVGTRGAQPAVFGVDPDVAVVLEGTPADDLPGSSNEERQGSLGHGVQIRLMDPSAIMNRKLAQYAIKTAEDRSIAHQIAVRKGGGTDAKPIHLHGRGVPTIVLGVPARYIHTSNGIICIRDYLSTLDLALSLIKGMDEGVVKSFASFED